MLRNTPFALFWLAGCHVLMPVGPQPDDSGAPQWDWLASPAPDPDMHVDGAVGVVVPGTDALVPAEAAPTPDTKKPSTFKDARTPDARTPDAGAVSAVCLQDKTLWSDQIQCSLFYSCCLRCEDSVGRYDITCTDTGCTCRLDGVPKVTCSTSVCKNAISLCCAKIK